MAYSAGRGAPGEAEIVDLGRKIWQRTAGLADSMALRVPAPKGFVPAAKSSPRIIDDTALDGFALEFAAAMVRGGPICSDPAHHRPHPARTGPGDGTLLGVDAVQDGRMIGRDLGEAAILNARPPSGDRRRWRLGGQGFLFGRGNQPLSARVLARVGRERILVVAGLEKLTALDPPRLVVDTGDPAVDAMLAGWMRVAQGLAARPWSGRS